MYVSYYEIRDEITTCFLLVSAAPVDSEPPIYERRKQALESLEDLRKETSFPFDCTKRDVENVTRRTFVKDNSATIRDPEAWEPATGGLMHATIHDDIPLLYMQRIRYHARDQGHHS